ncbi:MAG: metallophosphoesterase [Gemmataceae bacterium]
MRILFIGDIVGRPGVRIVRQAVPYLISSEGLDLVVANAENACGGSGLTPAVYHLLRQAGVDAITLGDHIYRRHEIIPLLQKDEPLCKPANYPAEAPGRPWVRVQARDGTPVIVFTLMGRLFMRPVDCPFRAADRVLDQISAYPYRVVDIHAEATADKALLGRYLDGKVGAIIGTHTHVPTADEQLLPNGSAFITDVGMTGPHDGVIGRRYDKVLASITTNVPVHYDVASGDVRLSGVIVDLHPGTGLAKSIRRIMLCEKDLSKLSTPVTGTA